MVSSLFDGIVVQTSRPEIRNHALDPRGSACSRAVGERKDCRDAGILAARTFSTAWLRSRACRPCFPRSSRTSMAMNDRYKRFAESRDGEAGARQCKTEELRIWLFLSLIMARCSRSSSSPVTASWCGSFISSPGRRLGERGAALWRERTHERAFTGACRRCLLLAGFGEQKR